MSLARSHEVAELGDIFVIMPRYWNVTSRWLSNVTAKGFFSLSGNVTSGWLHCPIFWVILLMSLKRDG